MELYPYSSTCFHYRPFTTHHHNPMPWGLWHGLAPYGFKILCRGLNKPFRYWINSCSSMVTGDLFPDQPSQNLNIDSDDFCYVKVKVTEGGGSVAPTHSEPRWTTLRPLYTREGPGTQWTEGWICTGTKDLATPHRDSIPGPFRPKRVAIPTTLSRAPSLSGTNHISHAEAPVETVWTLHWT